MKVVANSIIKTYLLDFDVDITSMLNVESVDLRENLSSKLLKLLNDSVINHKDVYTFKENEAYVRELTIDTKEYPTTLLEGDLNKINLIDYGYSRSRPEKMLISGISFSILIKRLLSELYRDVSFNVLFSFRISKYTSCIVNFHKIRENEFWISDNFPNEQFVDGIICFR